VRFRLGLLLLALEPLDVIPRFLHPLFQRWSAPKRRGSRRDTHLEALLSHPIERD
jgi:hypothetical protein